VTCADIQDRLDLLLLEQLPPGEAEALAAHLSSCAACRALWEDVRAIQAGAREIGTEGPSPRVWPRLAAAFEQDRHVQQARETVEQRAAPAAAGRYTWRSLAAAAVLVVALGVSLVVLQRPWLWPAANGDPPVTSADQAPSSLVDAVELELEKAAQHYENAIAGLEQIANASDSPLDPALMTTLRENLQMIDQAIDDSRQALRSEPQSQIAQESLFDAFRRKVTLLQDTIALMNEMRRGDQAGAAAMASELTKG
jgi:hypothetical protein